MTRNEFEGLLYIYASAIRRTEAVSRNSFADEQKAEQEEKAARDALIKYVEQVQEQLTKERDDYRSLWKEALVAVEKMKSDASWPPVYHPPNF